MVVGGSGQVNPEALEQFAAGRGAADSSARSEWVGAVDAGNREAHTFFDQRQASLRTPRRDSAKSTTRCDERYDYEVQKRAGGDLGLDRSSASSHRRDAPRAVRQSCREIREEAGGSNYYIGEEGRTLAILIRTPVEPGSIEPAHKLKAKIDDIVREVNPTSSIRA